MYAEPAYLRTVCISGTASKTPPSPSPTAQTIAGYPRPIPSRCGIVRRYPKFAPEAVAMTLLGPGVMDIETAKSATGKTSSNMERG